MKKKTFKDIGALAENMYELAVEEHKYVVAALFYDDAAELLKELLCIEDIEAGDIDLERWDMNHYGDEYYVSLTDDLQVAVEPALNEDGRYLGTECDILYVDRDADSGIIQDLEGTDCYMVNIGLYKDDDCDSEDDVEDEDESAFGDAMFDDFMDALRHADEEVDGKELEVNFILDEDSMADMHEDSLFYSTLLEIIQEAIKSSCYKYDDDGLIESVNVNVNEIFKSLRD